MSVTTQLAPSLASSWSIETRPSPCIRDFAPEASIVLVGSRGSGKRTLGFIGATHLGRRLVTEDHYFQEATGTSRGIFLRQYGNQEFYRKNVQVLKQMLDNHRTGCIIECGMGSLSYAAQKALAEYSKTHPVIYITRGSHRIKCLLRLGDEEAARLEIADLAHRNCSNLEYYNLYDPSGDGAETPPENGLGNVSSRLKYAKEDFSGFLDLLTGQGVIRSGFESPFSIAALPPECRSFTYALSLRLSTIPDLDLVELEAGADAVQLKIDTWSPDLQKLIGKYVATIRRNLGVPVIFQVENYAFEGTQLSMEEREHAYFILMEWALRLAVEYIIVDLKFSSERVSHLVRSSGRTRVIGHYLSRDENPWGWDEDARMIEYNRAKSLGCDMVRFVRATSKASDNDFVRAFVNRIESIPDHLPIVAYNLGDHGRPSLVANKIFTPVTHPIMNTTVSKSQIRQFLPTASEAMQALYQSKILDPLHFYHLGASVFYSLSPAMHTAAYQVCGMSNDFQSLQVSSLEDIHRIIQDPNFGGAAITQPFKVQILSRIAAKSYHAKAIGAVNTLLPLRLFQNGSPLDGSTESLLRQANQRCKAGPIAVCIHFISTFSFSPWNFLQIQGPSSECSEVSCTFRQTIFRMPQYFMYFQTNLALMFSRLSEHLNADIDISRLTMAITLISSES
jgi:3-dehydroquinate dehydratase type I